MRILTRTATVPGLLARAAETDAGVRFVDRDERATFFRWADVRARARRAAGALAAAGVRPGDRVAIALPTGPAFFDAFFGAQLAGAVPVPVPPGPDLAAPLRAADAALLVASPRATGPALRRAHPRLGLIAAADLAAGAAAPVVAADALAMVQLTAGTTAAPRPVALTHGHVLAHAAALDLRDDDALLSALPLDRTMGLVLAAMACGLPCTLLAPEDVAARPALWLRAVGRHRATVSLAPDATYARCAARVADAEVAGCDLSSWRLAAVAGAPVAGRTLRRFASRFAHLGLRPEALAPAYGLTEATLAVTVARGVRTLRLDRGVLAAGRTQPSDAPGAVEVVSVGRPVRGVAVEVRGPDGFPCREGVVGHVWVRGASVAAPGWIDTGDLGFLRGGELYVTGRARDAIIVRGRVHASHDAERALDDVPGVRAGCVAAVGAVEDAAERLLLFVESRAPHPELATRCRAVVTAATGLEPYLVFVLPPGTLPRTAAGHVRRAETLRRWRAGTLVASGAPARAAIATGR